ncbi:alpha,alpha-trehalase ath1 [Elasticomyces elasticus]|nr:alpha,alpha-trehalase ath1 [Elasticomyces elasticus]
MRHFRTGASALLVAARFADAIIYDTRFNGTTWDDDNWRITTTNLDQGHYQSRMSLANGYLGINLAAVGPFFEVDSPVNEDQINGWPLFDRRQTFATIAGFYDEQATTNGTNFEWLNQYGGESVISGVPHWAGLHVEVDGHLLDASVSGAQISGFSSTLDIGAGTMTWNYVWTPSGAPAMEIEYTMLVHKLYVNQAAVQLKITPTRDVNATFIDLLEGDCAVRTDFVAKGYEPVLPTIWTAVRPNGVSNVTAYIYSTMVGDDTVNHTSRTNVTMQSVVGTNSSTIAQAVNASLIAGQTTIVTKYIGGASSDAFSNPRGVALNGTTSAAQMGFSKMLHTHVAEWESIMTHDSVDNYAFSENGTLPDDANIVELQITSVTNPFNLLQNTIGANAIAAAGNNTKLDVNSISVCGLGSDCYAGLVFWDAEVWMAPGLVVAYPQAAKQIARYRLEKFPQAQANVKTAYQSSQNQTGKFSDGGAVYSWTSGRYGNCTGTGPCFDYEYHLNGDIGLELFNYYVATGDTAYFREYLFPVYDAIALFYTELLTYNETSGQYNFLNATDPDEYANHVDNAGFTMALMKTHIDQANAFRAMFNMPVNETWANISSRIDIPVDQAADIILEYATMNGSISVKQADVVLIDDFLNLPNPYSLSDLDYYAGKQSLNGPGMTYGVFSIVANEISPSGCSSYTYDLYGSQPYTRGPWFQYSEQLLDDFTANGGTHPAYPFLTGMGGANRVAIFGYLGLRLMVDTLNVDPSLPPQIPHLDYRTFYWQGWAINATSNQTHTTLTRLGTSLPNANATFATSAIPVTRAFNSTTTHALPPNGTLTLPNRQIGAIKTVPNNLAQCRPVFSNTTYSPGQFPLSAVDGAVSTKWQPARSNESSALTVELPPPYGARVTGFAFDWAQSPPLSYSVFFSNDSADLFGAPAVAGSSAVAASAPFDAAALAQIVPYTSNATNVSLAGGAEVYSARWATLVVRGNLLNVGTPDERNGSGATVAEWAIVAAEGGNLMQRYRPRRGAL